MMAPEFSRYLSIVSAEASKALGGIPPASPGGGTVALAASAAWMALGEGASQHAGLARGMQELAQMGKPWAGQRPLGEPDNGGRGSAGGRSVADSLAALAQSVQQEATGVARWRVPVVRDLTGHSRDAYHPLVLHLHLAALLGRRESLSEEVWQGCLRCLEPAAGPVRHVTDFSQDAPPRDRVSLVLWQALCLMEAALLEDNAAQAEAAEQAISQIATRPGPEGSLHEADEFESLDAWTYRELCGLHALANAALLRRHRAWALRVEEVAMYHLQNTQPDNVTTQPWGVFGFLWSPRTRSFAEQQLQDVATQAATVGKNPESEATGVTNGFASHSIAGAGAAATAGAGAARAVTGLLLADAARALAMFEVKG